MVNNGSHLDFLAIVDTWQEGFGIWSLFRSLLKEHSCFDVLDMDNAGSEPPRCPCGFWG